MDSDTPTTDAVLSLKLMPCAVAMHHINLTRKLERALRAILPYAENESRALYELRDKSDPQSIEQADEAFEAICAAHRVLDDVPSASYARCVSYAPADPVQGARGRETGRARRT